MTPLLRIVSGALLLLAGRRLYWLFVAVIGFGVALTLAADYMAERPQWQVIVIALAAGGAGALLAMFLQGLAIGLAGFVAGGYLALFLAQSVGWDPGRWQWLLIMVGGIIGAALVGAIFDWALILLSSLAGSALLVRGLALERPLYSVVFIIALLIGIAVQAAGRRPPHPERKKTNA